MHPEIEIQRSGPFGGRSLRFWKVLLGRARGVPSVAYLIPSTVNIYLCDSGSGPQIGFPDRISAGFF